MKKIFYDMDNVLALFSIKGNEGDSLERMFEKGFFRNLPVMQNAVIALKALTMLGFEVRIMSACVETPYCEVEKKEWLKEHFPFIPESHQHFCKVGENKAEMLKAQGIDMTDSYLVDDYKKNLIQWEEVGGLPIKKRFSDKGHWERVVKNHLDVLEIVLD